MSCTGACSWLRAWELYVCTSFFGHATRITIQDSIRSSLTLKCGDAFVLLSEMRHHLFKCSLPFARCSRTRAAIRSAHTHTPLSHNHYSYKHIDIDTLSQRAFSGHKPLPRPKSHRRELFMREDTYGTPLLPATAASINMTGRGNISSHGLTVKCAQRHRGWFHWTEHIRVPISVLW